MDDSVGNLVLEQLKLIRRDMGEMRGELAEVRGDVSDLKVSQQSIEGVLMALGGYMRGIDLRVEHIERKLGIDP